MQLVKGVKLGSTRGLCLHDLHRFFLFWVNQSLCSKPNSPLFASTLGNASPSFFDEGKKLLALTVT